LGFQEAEDVSVKGVEVIVSFLQNSGRIGEKVTVVMFVNGKQIYRMQLAIFIEDALVSVDAHTNASESDVPHIEVAVNSILNLGTHSRPSSERTPKILLVDHQLNKVHYLFGRWLLAHHLHAQPLLLDQLRLEFDHFGCRFLKRKLE
jgi:hypothetical protein